MSVWMVSDWVFLTKSSMDELKSTAVISSETSCE
jgi:hypothetical protein